MKLLLCHSYYQQRGGEDESFEAEAELLAGHGHEVIRYTRHNDSIKGRSQLSIAGQTLWSRSAEREIKALIREHRPAVMMSTNIFPLLSPSIYTAAQSEGVAVIQQLRNFRAFCLNGFFLREQKVCQDCLGKAFAWDGIRHRCYRNSRLGSTVVAAWQKSFRRTALRQRGVDLFLTPSEHMRSEFLAAGFDPQRVRYRPNVTSHVQGAGPNDGGGYALYVGRLSVEKGIGTVCEAWETLASEGLELQVAGDGPEASRVQSAADRGLLTWHGRVCLQRVHQLMADASVVIVPSIWYETFGRAAVEAYAAATPVIVADIGGLTEVVSDGESGFHFRPGDTADLVSKVRRFIADPGLTRRMGEAAQSLYQAKFTRERIYTQMMDLFELAIDLAGTHQAAEPRRINAPNEEE